ncbi:MAG: S-methyl-5'-thioadenosine phosphorylase [Deltaproteobacteria bacterium]|nr:MAG: S-methyl-5'-thioadenosine phosphorylase [Deltaproteobacteria bacterium]
MLGIVGGSGFYDVDDPRLGLSDVRRVEVSTPFGPPSAPLSVGRIDRPGRAPLDVVFVPRHGEGHRLLPSEVPYRANVHALRQLGVTHMLSVSAVGSLREEIAPGDFVMVDQFIDRTRHRRDTFFGNGVVAHVQFGEPVCPHLHAVVAACAESAGIRFHRRGTCVVIEGPTFSTRAESELYRHWGADVVGMTALPEARLAREAEIGYALVAMATDYDCWRTDTEEVSVEAVMAVMRSNVSRARALVGDVARALPETTVDLPVPSSLADAIVTQRDRIDEAARRRLELLLGPYL